MMFVLPAGLWWLTACSGAGPAAVPLNAPPPPEPIAPAPEQIAPAPAADEVEACLEAVEQPEQAGECATDADCATAGCSSELCVSAATASAGVMSVCLERPCQARLDTCGCVDGRCRWSLHPER